MLVDMVSSPQGAQTEWNITITFPQYKLTTSFKKRSWKAFIVKYIMSVKAIKTAAG